MIDFDNMFYEKYKDPDNCVTVFNDVFDYFEKNIRFVDLFRYYNFEFSKCFCYKQYGIMNYCDIYNVKIISFYYIYDNQGIHIFIEFFNYKFKLFINKSPLGLIKEYFNDSKKNKDWDINDYVNEFSYDLFITVYDLLKDCDLYNE